MRKIKAGPILFFNCCFILSLLLAAVSTWPFSNLFSSNSYKGIVCVFGFIFFVYAYSLISYRLFLKMMPLREGPIDEGSRQEFIYHVYLLFYLILFYQLIRTKLIPVPLLRIIYQCLGAKLGANTYCSGTILDPIFLIAGSNTIIGEDSLLYAHAIEGNHLSHQRIKIGNYVTIGAKSIIMSGVTIGDGAIVAAGSIVLKGVNIGPREIWAGVPAKKIGVSPKNP